MCRAGEFNLSFESLTSSRALDVLRDLPKEDPEFFKELYGFKESEPLPSTAIEDEETEESILAEGGDNPDVPLSVLKEIVSGVSGSTEKMPTVSQTRTDSSGRYQVGDDGSVIDNSISEAADLGDGDNFVAKLIAARDARVAAEDSEKLGRGQRRNRRPPARFRDDDNRY